MYDVGYTDNKAFSDVFKKMRVCLRSITGIDITWGECFS